MISAVEPFGSKPAFTIAPPHPQLELILDKTKYRVVCVIIQRKIKNMAQIETAYALGSGLLSDCKRLAEQWKCWAVLADEEWAAHQLKLQSARPQGAKVFFVS